MHALRPRVEQADERFLVLRSCALDELDQFGVGLGGVGAMPEHVGELVEIGGVERGADLVDRA